MSENPSGDPKRLYSGCLIKAFPCFVLIFAGGYFAQQWTKPNVDPEKTKPVVVTRPDMNDGDPQAEETANLPAGAITATISQRVIDEAQHPFDPLLRVAEQSIAEIDDNVRDYKATLISQVFVDGKIQPKKYLEVKIRHAHTYEGKAIPFSVYTRFLKPEANVGQEAIWVQGQNDGKLIAHTTGILNVKQFHVDPDGAIAMEGNRYPIREIGVRNLIVKMAQTAQKDRQHDECIVKIRRNVEINGCTCTMLQAVHPKRHDHFDFFIARIYIDDERNIPVAYEGFTWPEKEGGPAKLLEQYYYTNIELNVGLTDEDFNPNNPAYDYPAW